MNNDDQETRDGCLFVAIAATIATIASVIYAVTVIIGYHK